MDDYRADLSSDETAKSSNSAAIATQWSISVCRFNLAGDTRGSAEEDMRDGVG